MRTAMRATAAAALACAALSGCTINIGAHTPAGTASVSKGDLQRDITQRLTDSGQTAQSVTCPGDLSGQSGQSVRCDVTVSATSGFQAVVTVTSLDGDKVNYDITPAVSKTQLEVSVAPLAAATTNGAAVTVSCLSGLEGKLGAEAYCDVTAAGATTRRIVDVTNVSGLQMNYGLVPVLPKIVVEGSLVFQLRQVGQHPDSATCVGDLEGKIGSTVECATQSAGLTQSYVLTVTAVPNGNITYKYALKT